MTLAVRLFLSEVGLALKNRFQFPKDVARSFLLKEIFCLKQAGDADRCRI